ncbi:MAG: ATP synthase F1 subunit delta [Elusimicrobiaceae bacterium]|nr:ATP synthase F1 subunit delta [Elusimicrobiaceae bacterium]
MKSTDRILARRYARALDALSPDAEQAAFVCKNLAQAAALLERAAGYMQDPSVPLKQKKEFVSEVVTERIAAQFIETLLEAKRYYLLAACVSQTQQLLDERMGVMRAHVETAFELSKAQQERVEQTLGKFTGKTIQGQFAVKPELLGGLRVRMGDTLLDGSVQGRFEKLQEELTR